MPLHTNTDRSYAGQQRAHWFEARAWQTNLALLLLGFLLFLLSRHLISEYGDYTIGTSGVSGWSVWCYALGALLVFTRPTNRYTFSIILGVAIVCRLATLFADAYLSSDVYRYIWDGIVQQAGINPYRYVPADAHLRFLRDASEGNIYPAINRADYARTIYPPFAQILFLAISFISPTLTCMKTCMVLCEGITLWTLLRLLQALGRPREQAILYLWFPSLIWEVAGSGHLDSVIMALVGVALVARYRRLPVLTGLFLGLAVMTKFYPLVLFPALYMRSPKGRPPEWKMPATLAAVVVVGYALYSSAGKLVFGFLGGYVQEEGMASGSRYFLLELAQRVPGLHHLSASVFLGFAAVLLLALTLWAWQRSSPVDLPSRVHRPFTDREADAGAHPFAPHQSLAFLPPSLALATALMLLFSPHYAWYILWLTPFLVVMPNLPIFAYLTGFFYLYNTEYADPGPKMFFANQMLYGVIAGAVVLQLLVRRWLVVPHLAGEQRLVTSSVATDH